MRILNIYAIQIAKELSKPDDSEVEGIYAVEVAEHLSDGDTASAALDGFHSSIAIGMLDDFEFRVMDGNKQLEENSDNKGYESDAYGDVWYVDELPDDVKA